MKSLLTFKQPLRWVLWWVDEGHWTTIVVFNNLNPMPHIPGQQPGQVMKNFILCRNCMHYKCWGCKNKDPPIELWIYFYWFNLWRKELISELTNWWVKLCAMCLSTVLPTQTLIHVSQIVYEAVEVLDQQRHVLSEKGGGMFQNLWNLECTFYLLSMIRESALCIKLVCEITLVCQVGQFF